MQELPEALSRMQEGFAAYAATVDLLGLRNDMESNPFEARARINDIYQGFADGLVAHPGGESLRVCFAGDSVFVVRELYPGDDTDAAWSDFCGHIFALASLIHDMETNFGNPGLRAVLAYGPLLTLTDLDAWKRVPWSEQTRNWFALTGASTALAKCKKAEDAGTAGGFSRGYCWMEKKTEENVFLGVPFGSPMEPIGNSLIFDLMLSRVSGSARLA